MVEPMSTQLDINKITTAMTVNINKKILLEIAENPTSKVINLETLTLEQVYGFLLAQHSQEFMRHSIASAGSRDKVAHILIKMMFDLYNHINS